MATVTKPIALDESFNTTEVTPRNIADVLAEELSRITGRNASQVEYDNTDSGLTADNVQDALDEIVEDIPTVPSVDIQTAVDEFSTYNGGLLSSLKVSLSPNQDLHGYPQPWVGGSGKNKLQVTMATVTSQDVTATVYDDGTVLVNGTATGLCTFTLNNTLALNGNYILSGCPSGGDAGTFRMDCYWAGQGALIDSGNGVAISPNGNAITTRIVVMQGVTVNNQLFKPMIRLSTESDPTFEPYSNICPISGHTEVDILNVGKNRFSLADSTVSGAGVDYSYTQSTGILTKSGTSTGSGGYNIGTITVEQGDYTFSADFSHESGSGTQIILRDVATDVNIVTLTANNPTRNVTLDGEYYVRLATSSGATSGYITNVQLELGSTATPYEPYNGYRVTVNLGGTYYSGTLDVVSGVFVPDTAKLALNTSTIASISKSGLTDADIFLLFLPSSYKLSEKTILSHYGYENVQNVNEVGEAWLGTTITQLRIGFSAYGTTTLEDFKTWLDANNVEGCFELANPTPIQLSPTMVKALVGENHLSAPLEGQTIDEVKYKQMFTFDDVIAYIQSLS